MNTSETKSTYNKYCEIKDKILLLEKDFRELIKIYADENPGIVDIKSLVRMHEEFFFYGFKKINDYFEQTLIFKENSKKSDHI